MRCPLCPDSVLIVSHRHGIEVDHCPTCRGVWLDRGELDHLVDSIAERLGPRPATAVPPAPPAASPPAPGDHDRYEDRYDDRRRDQGHGRDRRKRRRKHAVLDLLEDVLDF